MKAKWESLKTKLIWTMLVIALLFLFIRASIKGATQSMQGVSIEIDQHNGNYFVNNKDIEELVLNENDLTVGKSLDSLYLKNIEKKIEHSFFVRNAEVFADQSGKVTIQVEQRTPIVRVINSNGVSFYLDEKGSFMSTSDKFTAHVPVVTGKIPVEYDSENSVEISDIITEIYNLSVFINEKPFWKAQIEQLYRTDNGEYFIIPKVGNHEIKFGTAHDFEQKFDKLMIFYKEGLSYTGWNEYKTIDITIDGQIVCTKK